MVEIKRHTKQSPKKKKITYDHFKTVQKIFKTEKTSDGRPSTDNSLHWQALQLAGHRCDDHNPYPQSAAAFRSISSPSRPREDPHRRITNSLGFSSSWVATHDSRGCKRLDPWLEDHCEPRAEGSQMHRGRDHLALGNPRTTHRGLHKSEGVEGSSPEIRNGSRPVSNFDDSGWFGSR